MLTSYLAVYFPYYAFSGCLRAFIRGTAPATHSALLLAFQPFATRVIMQDGTSAPYRHSNGARLLLIMLPVAVCGQRKDPLRCAMQEPKHRGHGSCVEAPNMQELYAIQLFLSQGESCPSWGYNLEIVNRFVCHEVSNYYTS